MFQHRPLQLAPILILLLAGSARPALAVFEWDHDRDEVRAKLTTAMDKSVRLVDELNLGKAEYTGRIQATVERAGEALRAELGHYNAGRLDFLDADQECGPGSTCDDFRGDIVLLLESARDLGNEVLATTPADARVEIDRIIGLIEDPDLPGDALYPLYIAAQETGGLTDSNARALLVDARDHVRAVGEGLRSLADGITADGRVDCDALGRSAVPDAATLQRAAEALNDTSVFLAVLGSFVEGVGEIEIQGEGAVWGWVGFALKGSKPAIAAAWLGGLSDGLGGLSDRILGRLSDCEAAARHDELVDLIGSPQGVLDRIDELDADLGDQLEAIDGGHLDRIDELDAGLHGRLDDLDAAHLAKLDAILDGQQEIRDRQDLVLANQELILSNQNDLRTAIADSLATLLAGQDELRLRMDGHAETLLEAIQNVGPPWGRARGHEGR